MVDIVQDRVSYGKTIHNPVKNAYLPTHIILKLPDAIADVFHNTFPFGLHVYLTTYYSIDFVDDVKPH